MAKVRTGAPAWHAILPRFVSSSTPSVTACTRAFACAARVNSTLSWGCRAPNAVGGAEEAAECCVGAGDPHCPRGGCTVWLRVLRSGVRAGRSQRMQVLCVSSASRSALRGRAQGPALGCNRLSRCPKEGLHGSVLRCISCPDAGVAPVHAHTPSTERPARASTAVNDPTTARDRRCAVETTHVEVPEARCDICASDRSERHSET